LFSIGERQVEFDHSYGCMAPAWGTADRGGMAGAPENFAAIEVELNPGHHFVVFPIIWALVPVHVYGPQLVQTLSI
jgi:hypothetical protein